MSIDYAVTAACRRHWRAKYNASYMVVVSGDVPHQWVGRMRKTDFVP